MKRSLLILLLVVVVAGLAGWGTAVVRISARERNAAEERKAKELEATKRPARILSTLAREADVAVISFRDGPRAREVRLLDRKWNNRLATLLAKGVYMQTPIGLWISKPNITLYRSNIPVLEVSVLGTVLRAYGEQVNGDFVVGTEITEAFLALAREKQPVLR